MGANNSIKMAERANKFERFTIVDKIIPTHDKSWINLVIHNDIKFTGMTQYDDTENTMSFVR